jgi:hypothetical protein
MGMREPPSVEAKAPRRRTTFEEYLQKNNITPDLPPEERLARVATLCRIFLNGAQHLSENLQPGEIERRIDTLDGIPCTIDTMTAMLQENEHVVGLMERCVQDMDTNPLSKINGTSFVFAECSRICTEQRQKLETGRDALAAVLSSRGRPAVEGVTQKLSCAACSCL